MCAAEPPMTSKGHCNMGMYVCMAACLKCMYMTLCSSQHYVSFSACVPLSCLLCVFPVRAHCVPVMFCLTFRLV